MLLLSIASILLAYISFRFVEKPFRNKLFLSRRSVFKLASLGFLFFIVEGFVGYKTNGFKAQMLSAKFTKK